jgi:predicted TIM-barrel fold metal-dependent hydrolase
MIFYDSHAHCISRQYGGLLIGLEGEPGLSGFMDNEAVRLAVREYPGRFLPCYYVTKEWNDVPDETILKYHPRREKYTAEEVMLDLRRRKCRICIIDTLNQPFWGYLDYWKIVSAFPKIQFILPHMGGYDIVDFIKILDFNKNAYCDFSMTQEYFGWCGPRPRFGHVADAIDYCLNNGKLNKKVLFGSDEPDFSQSMAVEKYAKLPNAGDILETNYLNLTGLL